MPAVRLLAPLSGRAVPLEDVPDPAFAGHMIGEGLAIDPTSSVLHAPCDGEVLSIHRAGHACTLRADDGAEILLHIGVDTVALGGRGFTPHVRGGERVLAGRPLISFDLDTITRLAPSAMTMMVILDGEAHFIGRMATGRSVATGDLVAVVDERPVEGEAEPAPSPRTAAPVAASAQSASADVVLALAQGLHARPAAALAGLAKAYGGRVRIGCGDRSADARSVVGLMGLGTALGDTLTVTVEGPDADVVARDLAARIAEGLGDEVVPIGTAASAPAAHAPAAPSASPLPSPVEPPFEADRETCLDGRIAVRGTAVGRAFRPVRVARSFAEVGAGAEIEAGRLAAALTEVAAQAGAAIATAERERASDRAAVFRAHLELLDDPELVDAAKRDIAAGHGAEWSWSRAIDRHVEVLEGLADPRMAERAADLRDLRTRVVAALSGEDAAAAFRSVPAGAVLITDELLPSELAAVPPGTLAGLCMSRGGPTSHVAIIAAAMDLPTVVALGPMLERVPDGAEVIVEGDLGRLRVFPAPVAAEAARAEVRRRSTERARNLQAAGLDCRTADGRRIEVFANIGTTADAREARRVGAEGVGLLRSEFLFLDRRSAPSEDEQLADYQAMADALEGRPLVIRTLDVGGDKPLAYLPLPSEENPALGLRGVRVSLRDRDLFATQVRAILRVRPAGVARIMVPMVATLAEFRAVRAIVEAERVALGRPEPIAVGVMIEVPSAAMIADRLAEEADFLSIGTNDLTQYALAMDRGNPHVAASVDVLHPGVLRLVAQTVAGAHRHGRPVAVCGGAASDPRLAALLIGLGVDELSATPAAVPDVKAVLRTLDSEICRNLAEAALAADGADDVRKILETIRS